MAIVLVIVIVAAGLAGAVLVRGRQDLQRRLRAAGDETRQAEERLAAVTAERDQLRGSQEWFAAANARATAEADRQRERADEQEQRHREAAERADDLERRQREVADDLEQRQRDAADDLERRERERAADLERRQRDAAEQAAANGAAEAGAGAGGGAGAFAGGGPPDDGVWLLLLAHIARRWGAVVGVPPAGRAVTTGSAADQLREAVARETERLREEVGVDVEVVVPAGDTGGAGGVERPRLGDNPADRVPALLAAVELLGVLAASAQQVTVTIGAELVLVGDGWFDDGELAAVRDRAAAAGAVVGPIVVDGERAEVVVAASDGAAAVVAGP